MTNMLAAALKYARHGTPIFPCDPVDKSPLCPHGFHDATTKEYQIRAWWRHWPNAMIGMPTGPRTQIWVLDVDALTSANVYSMRCLIGYTAMSTTPRGGWHFYFRWNGTNIKNSVGKLGLGVDVRGHGGYVILPPSVRADGTPYRWSAHNIKATEAPSWLIDEILKVQAQDRPRQEMPIISLNGPPRTTSAPLRDRIWARAALEEEIASVVAAPAGRRNRTLNKAAFNLFQIVAGGYLDEQEVWDRLFNAADACGLVADDGAQQTRGTIKSGARAGRKQPRQRPR
jgi:hypothetical protein